MMSHGFPNQFFTGYIQGGLNASTTENFSRQGYHIAYIIKEALSRGATFVEPTLEAQTDWVRSIRETAIDISQFQRECTPGYFNNEGDTRKPRWFLGDGYGPGWIAFQQLLEEWRTRGDLQGMVCR
jgi:cyclohexanone monooxygenase